MKFTLHTLIDVTETGARRGQDPFEYKQQANYMTLYQTIGLRTNATNFKVSSEERSAGTLGFGYKGKQKVWTVEFDVEAEASTSVEIMESDFDLVPVIKGLTETVDIDPACFRTKKSDNCNIVFERND
jgi:hypothetical protein